MREEDLLALKYILEERLLYLENMCHDLGSNLKEMHGLKLKDHADIISAQSQLRFEDSVLQRNAKEIKEIKSSLEKFETDIYGICEMCEDEIDIERLQAKPHARFCISCREIYEKTNIQKERT